MTQQFALAQLRHAYAQLHAGTVKDQRQFAEGLLGPAIAAIERANEQLVAPECVYEARYGAVHTANSPGRAWCQTHGFDCPNLALRGV